MKYICNKPGCNTLLTVRGYCDTHKHIPITNNRQAWDAIKARQDPEERAFYSNPTWTRVSKAKRIRDPLCAQCKRNGITTKGSLVHHNPELRYLLDNGLNPYLDEYLETLCMSCHNKTLNKHKTR